ncbi:hypothetical protein ACVWW1_003478 [Bradyrhizobium sp. JR3.5]
MTSSTCAAVRIDLPTNSPRTRLKPSFLKNAGMTVLVKMRLGSATMEAQLRLGIAAGHAVERRTELAVEFLGFQAGDLVAGEAVAERACQEHLLARLGIAGRAGQRLRERVIDDVELDRLRGRLLGKNASGQQTQCKRSYKRAPHVPYPYDGDARL